MKKPFEVPNGSKSYSYGKHEGVSLRGTDGELYWAIVPPSHPLHNRVFVGMRRLLVAIELYNEDERQKGL